MASETNKKVSLESILSNGVLTVVTTEYSIVDGIEKEVRKTHEGLTPLDIDEAERILPDDLLKQVKELWTDEVVENYKEMLEEQSAYNRYKPQPQMTESELLEGLRNMKMQWANSECEKAINGGITINLRGKELHFSYKQEDQNNIVQLRLNLMLVQSGIKINFDISEGIPYHANGCECEPWSLEEFMQIVTALDRHKFIHTTYSNLLKQYIKGIDTREELEQVVYIPTGENLPDMFKAKMDKLLGAVQNE